jgi:hypothetical protein
MTHSKDRSWWLSIPLTSTMQNGRAGLSNTQRATMMSVVLQAGCGVLLLGHGIARKGLKTSKMHREMGCTGELSHGTSRSLPLLLAAVHQCYISLRREKIVYLLAPGCSDSRQGSAGGLRRWWRGRLRSVRYGSWYMPIINLIDLINPHSQPNSQ